MHRRTLSCLSRFALLTAACSSALADTTIIDPDVPLQETIAEVSLTGYKRFPAEIFFAAKGDEIGIPIDVFYSSVENVPKLKQNFAEMGVEIDTIDVER